MKTEEDEAFDDLARKQGAWGGGFKAKQAMAKARIDDDDDTQIYKKLWVGLTDAEIDGYLDWDDWQIGTDRSIILGMIRDIEAKLRSKNT